MKDRVFVQHAVVVLPVTKIKKDERSFMELHECCLIPNYSSIVGSDLTKKNSLQVYIIIWCPHMVASLKENNLRLGRWIPYNFNQEANGMAKC